VGLGVAVGVAVGVSVAVGVVVGVSVAVAVAVGVAVGVLVAVAVGVGAGVRVAGVGAGVESVPPTWKLNEHPDSAVSVAPAPVRNARRPRLLVRVAGGVSKRASASVRSGVMTSIGDRW
jgi:hypothetical protein